MENYIVSARKYRPETFASVVGQENITATLKNAIKSGHLGHAYLFCGPRGVGKTTCARIFAKTINCNNLTDQYEACNECESCVSFNNTTAFNIHELDAASNNSVEDIRNLIEQVRIPPQVGNYSTYIIDEVHMLSAQAFNAFLKTLEEPPGHAIFILATTEKHKIIPTILSRCQIFDFQRIKVKDIVQYLESISTKEGVKYEPDAFNSIANKVDGSMRDALSIYDQLVSYAGNNITYLHVIENLNILDYEYYFKLTEAFLNRNISKVLLTFNEIIEKGFDGHHFINGLGNHFRDLLVCRDPSTIELLDVGAGIGEKYKQQSQLCSEQFLLQALETCSEADISYKSSRNQRLHVELTLIKLCNLTQDKKKTISPPDQVEDKAEEKTAPVETTKAEAPKEEKKDSQDIQVASPSENIEKESKPVAKTATPVEKKSKKKIPSSGYSIKDALNGSNNTDTSADQKDSVTEEQVTSEAESFSVEDIHREWNAFAESLKSKRPRMYSTLKSHLPSMGEDYIISLVLDNSTQKDEFARELKHDIQRYLQKNLKNHKIGIEMTVKPDEDGPAKLYTAEEKFEHMIKKNPTLGRLKQDFNLDFE